MRALTARPEFLKIHDDPNGHPLARLIGNTTAGFPLTRWTLLRRLGSASDEEAAAARQRLAEVYWPAAYAWFRRRGLSRDDAAEATQEFFSRIVIGRRLFERADKRRGRVRALIATALRNFHIDGLHRSVRRKRVVVLPPERLDEEEQRLARNGGEPTPDEAFSLRWAVSVLEEAMRRCEAHYAANGPQAYWQAFNEYTVRPHTSGNRPPPLATVAQAVGLKSAAHAAVAVFHVRKRCRALIMEVIAETTVSEADRQAEYAAMLARLGVLSSAMEGCV